MVDRMEDTCVIAWAASIPKSRVSEPASYIHRVVWKILPTLSSYSHGHGDLSLPNHCSYRIWLRASYALVPGCIPK